MALTDAIAAAEAAETVYSGLLTDTCTIRTDPSITDDGWGDTAEPDITKWTETATGVACRLDTKGGKEITEGKLTVIADATLFMLQSQAINEKQVIEIPAGTYWNILLVASPGGADHHKELALEEVRA